MVHYGSWLRIFRYLCSTIPPLKVIKLFKELFYFHRYIDKMIESDILFPWLDPNLHAMMDQLKDLKNCEVMCKVRKFKQIIQRHPVASVFLSTFVITGFLPFFLFLAFVAGSSIFVLFSLLLFQGGVLALGLLSLLGVFVPIVLFGTKIAAIVYVIYIITATVLRVAHILTKTIIWLPNVIVTVLSQKFHDIFALLGEAVRVELERRRSSAFLSWQSEFDNIDNECMKGEQLRRRHYHTERSDNLSDSLDRKVKLETIRVDGRRMASIPGWCVSWDQYKKS